MHKNILTTFLVLSLVLFSPLSPLSKVEATSTYNQASAQTYLLSHTNDPWVTMSLSALGASNIPSDYLKNISYDKAVKYEAPILAITSLGKDPRTFGSTNLIDKLKSFFSGGQLGEDSTINDDVFGILALTSSGVPATDPVIVGAKNFILSHQNENGSFGWTTFGDADSGITAAAILALKAAGVNESDNHIQSALNFLKTAQNNDGGFTSDPASSWGTDSDPSSTASVIWALNGLAISPSSWTKSGHSPVDYLVSQQNANGYFATEDNAFTPVQTAYSVIALTGKSLPVNSITASLPTVGFRIEGSSASVCNGQIAAQTVMDVIKNSATTCGFTFNIDNDNLGPYLTQINTDAAAGATGWLYLVNNTLPPSTGAADYQLKDGDSVLWYYGLSGWKPTKLDLSAVTANSGQTVTATVQGFENSSFSALSAATVYFGTGNNSSDSSGHASITAPDGYYQVYAQKTGYIRSNQVLLKIGEPSASSVSLAANFSGGQVNGTSTQPTLPSSISFTVDSSSLNFGSVAPGSQVAKTLHIQNNSSGNISLAASVSGDTLFGNNLWLNNKFWQKFNTTVNSGQSLAVDALLKIPAGFSGSSGSKTGQLIIWATGQ